jgi:SAM-dependent methyltransferase
MKNSAEFTASGSNSNMSSAGKRRMSFTSMAGKLHSGLVLTRRASVLAKHMADLIPLNARVLDVGCGDGMIDSLIQQTRQDVSISGIDVMVRPNPGIPVKVFDGDAIPYPDLSFDVAMFVDVLHHTKDPLRLLKEGYRVARTMLIKDHLREGLFSAQTLRFMDWFGNAYHGVALPYNYWSSNQWNEAFRFLGLTPSKLESSLGLYPAPLSWIFERKLHFVARIERSN